MENKKKIAVITATRAEYGLLSRVIHRIASDPFFDLKLAVTGTHLSHEHGYTIEEIRSDNIDISVEIEILLASDSSLAIAKSGALAILGFAEWFQREQPDGVLVLGDRYEIMAICYAATCFQIPIFHIHGGESTFGAIDESFRHAITKMSLLHFTSCEEYRRRVIQLGENPIRVFNVGALGVENCHNIEPIPLQQLEDSIDFNLHSLPFAVVTFHPVTLEAQSAISQIHELLSALDKRPDISYLFTLSNADSGGAAINKIIKQYVAERDNCLAVASLGYLRYYSALHYACAIIGNSSSGIIEAPSFHLPTINIGDRQAGRVQASSIINCEPTQSEILDAIDLALSPTMKQLCSECKNPYDKPHTAKSIVDKIVEFWSNPISLKKEFYDLPQNYREI